MLRRPILFALLVAGLPAPALADMKATYLQPRLFATMIVETADNGDAVLQFSQQNWRYQVVGGEGYVVYSLSAGTRVARLRDLQQLFLERRPPLPAEAAILEGLTLARRGTARFAGYSGPAYYFATPGERTASPIPLLVVSTDSGLAPIGRAIAGQMDFSLVSYRLAGMAVPPVLLAMREALGSGTPLSFFGFELQSIERTRIDPARFRLPAPPVTMEELRTGRLPQIG